MIFEIVDNEKQIEFSKRINNDVDFVFIKFLSNLIDLINKHNLTIIYNIIVIFSLFKIVFVMFVCKNCYANFQKFIDNNVKNLHEVRTI